MTDKATPSPASVDSVCELLNICCVTFAKWKELGKRGRTAEEEDAALREMRDAQENFRAEVERLAAQAAPTEPKHPLLNITAKQLRAALDFANPDPDDPDQLEAKVCIQWGEARDDGDGGTEPAGLRAWLAECPEEGSISLDLWGTEGGLV